MARKNPREDLRQFNMEIDAHLRKQLKLEAIEQDTNVTRLVTKYIINGITKDRQARGVLSDDEEPDF